MHSRNAEDHACPGPYVESTTIPPCKEHFPQPGLLRHVTGFPCLRLLRDLRHLLLPYPVSRGEPVSTSTELSTGRRAEEGGFPRSDVVTLRAVGALLYP